MRNKMTSSLTTLILLPTIFNLKIITCLNIFCDYSMQNFSLLNKNPIYTCTVADMTKVTEPNLEVSRINGEHFNGSKNENVHGFNIEAKVVNFWPKNLDSFFTFLSAISIVSSNLSVVNQYDLTPFTNLRFLDLHDNKIEYLSKDLFVYNPNLEVVILNLNIIANIDPDVFDYLNYLRYLNLETNQCISDMETDRNGVKILITEVKEKCNNCNFEQQKILKNSLENLNISHKIQLDSLKAEIESLRAQNFEITRRSQMVNGNLTDEIDDLHAKIAQTKTMANRRVFLLTVMLVIMCVLLIAFTVIIIFLIFNMKSWKNKAENVIEIPERNTEVIVMRRMCGMKRLSENLYEDINRGPIIESAYDKLQYL